MHLRDVFFLALTVASAAACSSSDGSGGATSTTDAGAAAADDLDSGSTTHTASAALRRCAVGRTEPTSIGAAITRINALAPADGPCIIAALPRPLSIVATLDQGSAQPAGGPDSPRIFFVMSKLIISAVLSGKGSQVLEFGERASATATIKGELPIPVTEAVADDLPYRRILNTQQIGTVCGTCHGGEHAASIAKAFISNIVEPPAAQAVSVAELKVMHEKCTTDGDTSDRCAMLHAVFDLGPVVDGSLLTY